VAAIFVSPFIKGVGHEGAWNELYVDRIKYAWLLIEPRGVEPL